jgi:hypothetical protein
LLVQHFGLERLTIKDKTRSFVGKDGQFDCELDGYEISLDCLGSEEKTFLEAFEFFNNPCGYNFSTAEAARLRICLARRAESNEDITLLIDTSASIFESFPRDIVRHVVMSVIANEKWMPTISEIKKTMEKEALFRKKMLEKFYEVIQLQQQKPEQIEMKSNAPSPTRRELCDFLKTTEIHADRNFFDDVNYSTPQIETVAVAFGFLKPVPEMNFQDLKD